MSKSMSVTVSSNNVLAQAEQYISHREFNKAECLLAEVIHGGNASAQLHYQLGVAKAMSGRQLKALPDFRQAIALDPSFSEGYNGLALALAELGELIAANDVCEQAFTLSKPCLKLYSTWAKILLRLNRLNRAKDVLEKALQLQPNNPALWSNLASVAGELNDKSMAISCFERALELNPAALELHGYIADHRSYESNQDAHLATMLQAWQTAAKPKAKAGVAFGLARAYEKLNDFAQAATFYRQANDILYKQAPYNHDKTRQQFDAVKTFFNRDNIERLSAYGSSDDTPIFIVGMPRSGTSRVEQILASHSQVFGAGELNYVKTLLLRSGDYSADDFVTAQLDTTAEKVRHIAEQYLRLLRQYDRKAMHITDKMPHNFRLLGFIRCLFPNARIIHCQRQKQDVVLSNYKANFSANLRYSTNLTAAFNFYSAYEDLMAHWQAVLPGKMHTVRYENLVANQKGETEALLNYCNLPWQDECLNYHETQRSVATASAAQVKQPLYTSSVDYWRKFAIYLPELQR